MADGFTIVPVERRDQIDQVRALFREYAASLGFSLCFQSFDQELARLPGEYAFPEGRLLLASRGPAPAGCVALRKLEGTLGEMKRLYVRPEFRGLGLGRDLVLMLIEEARRSQYERMRLDTIASSMATAVSLYRSLGFCDIEAYRP